MGLSVDRIQGLSGGLAIKAPCLTATTADIVWLNGLSTVGGVALAAGDRVLVKDQTDPKENGIYNADTGDWKRALDFNGPNDVIDGTQVLVTGGTWAGWFFTAQVVGAPVLPGASAITFGGSLPPADIVAALALKAPIASPTFTGTVGGVTKAHVGLGSVDNTSDLNKPISTATQTSLDLKVPRTSATGSAIVPAGTEAQRDGSPAAGYLRFNADVPGFEGYDGAEWGSIGGGGGAINGIFYENDILVTADYTISTNKNAMSAGPIEIDTGITVTVPVNSVWSIV